jgi:hypothetical protein
VSARVPTSPASSAISAELAARLQADLDHHGRALPEALAHAWRGYLAAALEWNVITVADYDALRARLPAVADDPAITILRGRL